MRLARPRWGDLVLVFGLGAVAALGQAPLGAWWLALPGFSMLLARLVRAETGAAALWLGWFGGAGYFAASLNWIVEPFLIDIAQYGWMAPFALVFLSFGLALFWAVASGVARRWLPGAMGLALCLSVVELGRGYVLTGFPWALPGHIWIETPMVQLAAFVGANGLTLITLMMAALPLLHARRGLLAAAMVLALGWGFGLMRLAAPDPAAPGVTLRLVQPYAEQQLKWDPDQAATLFDRQIGFTRALPSPDIVIWPETAVPYIFQPGEGAAAEISAAAGTALPVVGAQRLAGDAAYNSLVVLGAGGQVTALYDKHHLVPFGEYLPFGDLAYRWFGLAAFAAQEGYGYAGGAAPMVLDLGPKLGRVLPLICYEAVFPQDLRGAGGRADWILQITNDAWFGRWTGPFQHAAQARLRAVEVGLPLVRVANTGVTLVADARGRVAAELPFDQAAYLDAALPGAEPETPYARWGEAPVLVLLAGLALALIAKRRRTLT